MAPAPREPRYTPEDIATMEEAAIEMDDIGLDVDGEFVGEGDFTQYDDQPVSTD